MSSDAEETSEKPNILDGLEARLHANSKAFESLLALTPARDYYGSQIVDGLDPSEQWNRKKQTKEEKRAAKKAKLDPANNKSALDVLKEREEQVKAKRKREADGGAFGDVDQPKANGKKRKVEVAGDDEEAKRRQKAEKRKEKRLKKKERSEKKKAKVEGKKAAKQDDDLAEVQLERTPSNAIDDGQDEDESDDEAEPAAHPADMGDFDMSDLAEDEQQLIGELKDDASDSSAPTTPIIESPAFDVATNHSAASSSSSISLHSMTEQPPSPPEQRRPQLALSTELPKTETGPTTTPGDTLSTSRSKDVTSGTSSPKIQLPDIDAEELRARFNKRYQELRAARKADGPDGEPIKSRQDIMEQRRKKAEQRKATKKAQRQKAKEEEARKREEQLRGSGSPLSKVGDVFSPPPSRQNNYAFSRLAFGDGVSGSATLDSLNEPSETANRKKQKGPCDPKTALQATEARDAKLASLPAHKQALQSQRNMWSNAASRAHGDRPRDDTSLLKKALKRKEKQKGKSGQEWKEREQGVIKAREAGQAKRERNLQKRREEKGGKGKGNKKKGGKGGGGPAKKKGRAGFEGRWKA